MDGLSVSLAIQPSDSRMRLIVRRGEQTLFELNAVGVQDLRVVDQRGVDAVDIVLSEHSSLRLQLRPVLEVTQESER